MTVESELAQIKPAREMCVTIGVFDGVHPGHQYLINKVKEQAAQANYLSGVVTFDRHPTALLDPAAELPYLTSLEERAEIMKELGIDHVIVLSFTPELVQLTAREFATLLRKYLRMRELIVGPDFVLGKGREGNTDVLRSLGEELGFTVIVLSPVTVEEQVVSSTAIRNMLKEGNVETVTRMLGRRFRMTGIVTYGDARGGKVLGFPTANLEVNSHHAIPAPGGYVTLAHVDGETYRAVTNIGTRPTFGPGPRTVETHLLDFDGYLYGRELSIEFVKRLREETKFESFDDLKRQIENDVAIAREVTIN